MAAKVTVPALQAMKKAGEPIVAIVAWDFQLARIAERAGADLLVVGDSVGVNLWGHSGPFEITVDEMIVVGKAVRRAAQRALVCVDVPFGPVQEGVGEAVKAAVRLVKEAGADLVKLDAAGDYPEAVTAIERAGIPVFGQFGITPQRALRFGVDYHDMAGALLPDDMTGELVAEAVRIEAAGASLLDFTNSGPVAGPAVVDAVSVPVLGGFGGGPWLDGRVRMGHAAIGYAAKGLDHPPDTYANVAATALEAFTAYAGDVRSGRQIRGGIPVPAPANAGEAE